MRDEQVLVIGYGGTSFEAVKITEPRNLNEFKVILLEVSWLWRANSNVITASGIEQLFNKMAQLEKWVAKGGTLVIVLDEPFEGLKIHGTTNHFDIRELPMIKKLGPRRSSGKNTKSTPSKWGDVLAEWADRIEYHYLLEWPGSIDLLIVDTALGEKQVVASAVPVEQGIIIAVPPAGEQWRQEYIGELSTLAERLRDVPSPLPKWVDDYGPSDEARMKADIDRLTTDIAKREREIADLERKIADRHWLKVLAAGTGNDFMAAAKKGLEALGFRVAAVPGNRTDLIAVDEQWVLACETKGLERGGKEADVRQAATWMAEVGLALVTGLAEARPDPHLEQCVSALADLGVETGEELGKPYTVRGLLILGTYRNLSLPERGAEDFSNDMLQSATRSGVCVLTGMDLVNLVLVCEEQEQQKAAIRRKMFETTGRFCMEGVPKGFAPR